MRKRAVRKVTKARKAPARKPAARRAARAKAAPPSGHRSVTPYIIVKGAAAAIDFYQRAFGAREVMRMAGPGGAIMHAEIRIGDSVVFMTDENPQWGCVGPLTLGGTHGSLHLAVKDVDAAFKKAVAAGASGTMPPENMFWGDRYGKVKDPFGHDWGLAQTLEVLTPRELRKRGQAFAAQMAAQAPPIPEAPADRG